MSIATRGAKRKFPSNLSPWTSDNRIENQDNAIAAKGYVSGRTAPITDEEVEAGAKGAYEALCGLGLFGFPVVPYESAGHEQLWDNMRAVARAVFEAARKKVAE